MDEAKHTPVPWVQEAEYISAQVPGGRPNGEIIVQCWPTVARLRHEVPNAANAAFIVRACNAHEDLVAALRWALERLSDARNVCYGGVRVEEIERREQVLAKAEGQP